MSELKKTSTGDEMKPQYGDTDVYVNSHGDALIACGCHAVDHNVRVERGEDGEVYFDVCFTREDSFLGRLKGAWYALMNGSHYHTMILHPGAAKALAEHLNPPLIRTISISSTIPTYGPASHLGNTTNG